LQSIRILIVDDHLVVRQGLKSLLSQYADLQVVADVDNGSLVMDAVELHKPDIILLDIKLGEFNGLHIARQITRVYPQVKIIVLTSYDDDAFLMQAVQVGVHGYLLKSSSAEVLAEAIRAIHAGERRLSPALANKVFEQLEIANRSLEQSRLGLSDQEVQMLKLMADGLTAQEMAKALYLSERTVKRKTQELLEKMAVANRTQAVAEAFRRGVL
jgi:two-component system response regulator DevR